MAICNPGGDDVQHKEGVFWGIPPNHHLKNPVRNQRRLKKNNPKVQEKSILNNTIVKKSYHSQSSIVLSWLSWPFTNRHPSGS